MNRGRFHCTNIKVTSKCNKDCEFCYERERNHFGQDLHFETISSLLDSLKELKFKEIRISGGEPLIRNDLAEIIKKAKKLSFKVVLSTNGDLLDSMRLKELQQASLDELYISVGDTIDPSKINRIGYLINLFKNENTDLRIGLNVIIGKSLLRNITETLGLFAQNNIRLLYLMPPKKCLNKAWMKKERLDFIDYFIIYKLIIHFQDCFNFLLDCSLYWVRLFKNHNNPVNHACNIGFVVNNNGSIAPCTYFNDEKYCIGNIFETPIGDILERKSDFKAFEKLFTDKQMGNQLWENPCLR